MSLRRTTGDGGEIHDVMGEIELPVRISCLALNHLSYVFQEIHLPILVGLDFLETNKVNINLAKL